MDVVFRVDASQVIGLGHISRCITLAVELQRRGVQVHFMCRDLPGNSVDWLRLRGYHVIVLGTQTDPSPPDSGGYGAWLAVCIEEEIRQCQSALMGSKVDWLILDHYALDLRWELEVCPDDTNLFVIDDLANRHHKCHMLLDQNYYPNAEQRYAGMAEEACLLLGPQYALLRSDFADRRKQLRPREGVVRKLLVFFGGSDIANVTVTALHAMDAVRHLSLQIDVVVGQINPNIEEVAQLCQQVGAKLHYQVDDMATLMERADLAIGATGVSTWERAALGLPTIAVSVADNQREIAHHAHDIGLLLSLGESESVGVSDWRDALTWACSNPEALIRQSQVGMRLVDGFGAQRVVEKMFAYHSCMH